MSDSNAAEELRALLQSQSFQAPPTPQRQKGEAGNVSSSTDIPVLNELAALIGSLDAKQTPSKHASLKVLQCVYVCIFVCLCFIWL